MKVVRIGCGAGFSGDRIDPAVTLAEEGKLDYLVFECLAERTIALAQKERLRNPQAGYDPFLEERMRAVLSTCFKNGTKIVTNMGAANPLSAAALVKRVARETGLSGIKIAAVTGDDVFHLIDWENTTLTGNGERASALKDKAVSANAYLGHEGIIEALARSANVVITGRVADPSLFVAPLMAEFGWDPENWQALGQATVIGHLMECAGQVTGGYFADPGYKEVTGLSSLGYPLAEVQEGTGEAVITKVAGTGGIVSVDTCKEQLLYEIFDPSSYLTPDVTADFTQVRLEMAGKDRVRVSRGQGRPRPAQYKVSIGCLDGFIGEGQISYGGSGALARAKLAGQIIRERLSLRALDFEELHMSYIGYNSLSRSSPQDVPREVRLRVAGRARSFAVARVIGEEVESLYTTGPAGGGGVTKAVREVLAVSSTLLARDGVNIAVHMEEVE